MANIMNAKDAVSASLAKCFVTLEGNRYEFMQAINLEANFEKVKTEVPILGKTGKGNKANGWRGTGNATFHYNTSIFRKLLKRYKDTGEDIYFDIQVTNEDPSSAVGRQTVILKGCNLMVGSLQSLMLMMNTWMKQLTSPLKILKCLKNSQCFQVCSKNLTLKPSLASVILF